MSQNTSRALREVEAAKRRHQTDPEFSTIIIIVVEIASGPPFFTGSCVARDLSAACFTFTAFLASDSRVDYV